MRSTATTRPASPTPPAHTRGTPKSPSSFTSCSALFGPACPPARWFTAIRPRTPESSPFRAHFRSVTSWYTRPPTWATRSTTHRGLPSDVIKNRTPSSIATRSEEHTSELQSRPHLVCRLLLETKNNTILKKAYAGRHDVVQLELKTRQPIAFDAISDSESTGRFVIVDGYDIAGGGIIIATVED